MIADNYYEIVSLAVLGELSSAPPFRLYEFLSRLADNPGCYDRVKVLFLHDDLLQRQGFLSGELKEISPSVLTVNQIRNEEPLPDYLISVSAERWRSEVDNVWDNYFHYADREALRLGSDFLHKWVGFEVGLRNALADERAKRLGLEPEMYKVAEDLQSREEDFSDVINEWRSADTPLSGLQILIRYRWEWVKDNEPYFTFKADELAVYGLRLMLLTQWHRLSEYRSDNNG